MIFIWFSLGKVSSFYFRYFFRFSRLDLEKLCTSRSLGKKKMTISSKIVWTNWHASIDWQLCKIHTEVKEKIMIFPKKGKTLPSLVIITIENSHGKYSKASHINVHIQTETQFDSNCSMHTYMQRQMANSNKWSVFLFVVVVVVIKYSLSLPFDYVKKVKQRLFNVDEVTTFVALTYIKIRTMCSAIVQLQKTVQININGGIIGKQHKCLPKASVHCPTCHRR